MTTGLDRFNSRVKKTKQFASSVSREEKKNKLAAEGHMLKQEEKKRLATESLEEKMTRTGVENFATGEVVDYKAANADDDVWGFMNKSFYNRLIADTTKSIEEKVELEMMNNLEAVLNSVLDTRENNKRQMELVMAQETTKQMELRVRELELQAEILRLQVAPKAEPIEFELTPMIPATHGKLGEVMEEHSKAVKMITDVIEVVEKPVKKQRKARVKKTLMDVQSELEMELALTPTSPIEGKVYEVLEDGPSTPIRNNKGRITIAWKKVIESDNMLSTIHHILLFLKDEGVDVRKPTAKNIHPMLLSAYQHHNKVYSGRGSWSALLQEFGL